MSEQSTKIVVRERARRGRKVEMNDERWRNDATGEILEVTTQTITTGDLDFQKIWVANILAAVDEISNAKIKVLWYLLSAVDPRTNTLMQTVQQIAKGSNTSVDTVKRTLRVLTANDILRRPFTRAVGVLMLNPNVMMQGNTGKRRALLIRFEQMPLPLFEDCPSPAQREAISA